jgi:hypothetical protein
MVVTWWWVSFWGISDRYPRGVFRPVAGNFNQKTKSEMTATQSLRAISIIHWVHHPNSRISGGAFC